MFFFFSAKDADNEKSYIEKPFSFHSVSIKAVKDISYYFIFL